MEYQLQQQLYQGSNPSRSFKVMTQPENAGEFNKLFLSNDIVIETKKWLINFLNLYEKCLCWKNQWNESSCDLSILKSFDGSVKSWLARCIQIAPYLECLDLDNCETIVCSCAMKTLKLESPLISHLSLSYFSLSTLSSNSRASKYCL